jgi:hypothetical protein
MATSASPRNSKTNRSTAKSPSNIAKLVRGELRVC